MRIGTWNLDHIAVPSGSTPLARAVDASSDGWRLSDHDAYVLELS